MRSVFLRRALAAQVALLAGVVSIVSCGGKSSPAVQSGTVAFIEQPTSLAVPIGRTATFTADATTLPSLNPVYPITYQWTKNGVAIPGATGTSYTTPTVALADSGTKYQVMASSGSNSLGSSIVTLTAGPRAPAIGDVRYLLWQQVVVPWSFNDGGAGDLGAGVYSIPNALGTPLPVGAAASGDCVWEFSYQFVPTSMNGQFEMYYQLDNSQIESWQSYLESVDSPNVVITSVDLSPGCGILGAAWVQVKTGGFDYKLEEVQASQLGATIANDGSESRIVTAVTYDTTANEWALISYGWQGDTTTLYDAQSAIIPGGTSGQVGAQVYSEAQTLASQGYFVSACGGDFTDGFLLVGMRTKGDTLPRPIFQGGSGTPANSDNAYWTYVTWESPTMILEQ